jgi:hypothetical protein
VLQVFLWALAHPVPAHPTRAHEVPGYHVPDTRPARVRGGGARIGRDGSPGAAPRGRTTRDAEVSSEPVAKEGNGVTSHTGIEVLDTGGG